MITSGLIGLLVSILIICIIGYLITYVVDMFPLPARIKQLVNVVVWLIVLLAILQRLLPILGVSI